MHMAARSAGVERSPRFPFIGVSTAIQRVTALADQARQSSVRLVNAAEIWELSATSSSLLQTVAALLSYGLIDEVGSGADRQIRVSALTRKLLEDKRPGAREEAIAEVVRKPRAVGEHIKKWGARRPSHGVALSELQFESHFTRDGAVRFLRIFDEAIQTLEQHGVLDVSVDPASENVAPHASTKDDVPLLKSDPIELIHGSNNGMTGRAGIALDVHNNGLPSPADLRDHDASGPHIRVLFDGSEVHVTARVRADGLRKLIKALQAQQSLLDQNDGEG